jgi:hypothetical protein
MRLLASCVLVLVGCGESNNHAAQPDGAPATVVEPCPAITSLYGMGPATATVIASRTYDTAGVDYCLALDARDNLRVAHFMVGTPYEDGTTSNFGLTLIAADGSTIQEGWDVGVGQTNTRTFENLEYSIAERIVLSAKLHVRAKVATVTGEIGLSLFEPYE